MARVKTAAFAMATIVAFGAAAQAQSIFISCDRWEQMPTNFRETYVAAVIDTLSTIAIPEQASVATYYNACIVKSGMSLGQITEGAREFIELHSELRYKPAPSAIMTYLISLCGALKPSEGALPKVFASTEIAGSHSQFRRH